MEEKGIGRCFAGRVREYGGGGHTVERGRDRRDSTHGRWRRGDSAAGGGGEGTNGSGGKTTVGQECGNIMCGDAAGAGLVAAVEAGVALSQDRARRRANCCCRCC